MVLPREPGAGMALPRMRGRGEVGGRDSTMKTFMELLSRLDAGDVIDEMESLFAEVQSAVLRYREAGSVTLKISLAAAKGTETQLVMAASVKGKVPGGVVCSHVTDLWAVDGGVTDEDPQQSLPGFLTEDGRLRYAHEMVS